MKSPPYKFVRKLLYSLLDCVYPAVCPICNKVSDRAERSICWNCLVNLRFHDYKLPHCVKCGKIGAGEMTENFLCTQCTRRMPAFDMARTSVVFTEEMRKTIHVFKYRRGTWLTNDLGDMLAGTLSAAFDANAIDLIVPIPLHWLRRYRRAYNQSELLAKALSSRTDIECRNDLISRKSVTSTQTRLNAAQRKANVKHAFKVIRPEFVKERTVLLVDDVMTTGATLSEAATALKMAGAIRVFAIALARG